MRRCGRIARSLRRRRISVSKTTHAKRRSPTSTASYLVTCGKSSAFCSMIVDKMWVSRTARNSQSVHVFPENDAVEHDCESIGECICGPLLQYVDDDGSSFEIPLVTHHSLDGRENCE